MQNKTIPLDDKVSEVFEQYSDMVYKLALTRTKNKADADDVFQEVFLRFLKHSKEMDSEEHKKAWLIRVTINCSKKLFDSAWFRRTTPIEDNIKFNDEEKEVYFSVMELPVKYRTVIHLHYYEDMTISDISKILKIKESTIKSQLKRARALLKLKLKGEYDDV
ncbi:ECF subfamily RNA polymerase sigma-24 subunit [Clostridium acetobutylicum]|nr:ECF subfamily RNA polymerase sigma-24 subunit [Clostridium acetobutylicum]